MLLYEVYIAQSTARAGSPRLALYWLPYAEAQPISMQSFIASIHELKSLTHLEPHSVSDNEL